MPPPSYPTVRADLTVVGPAWGNGAAAYFVRSTMISRVTSQTFGSVERPDEPAA
jgi:hypothetical protein